ncbi:hypothetical protein HMPREF9093_02133 [Fusobacterium sp. oral taxon 370 str. F0437]|uniref:hypothetical protein n=1 Tax=Fusobacterium sp. oral taxon 370 TaxID=712288 RepID=UPI000234A533|nr:hypothetical protein [Fusobacterium sp. oral taxon 370]EHI76241.1 hypothetical protein HMPREF9093_02133 [Fusobacterium sp. oral taxon 370 str. F0437]
MGLLKNISMLVEEEIEDKEEVETSNESISAENFDKFMKGKYDILIPGWLGIFQEEKDDERDISPWLRKEKAIKEDSEKTEEEKYLESIFKGQKNEFDLIFLALNNNETDKIDESPEEKLKKFNWINFENENFYLDDNVRVAKNIKTEIYLTDDEIKNGTTKLVDFERLELITKYNYIDGSETSEIIPVKYTKEITIPANIEEGTVYKFVGFGNCFEDIDENIQQGDLYVFVLRGDKNDKNC